MAENFSTEGLTEVQIASIKCREEHQKGKYFSGVSLKCLADDFRGINNLADRDLAKRLELDLFEICRYKPDPDETSL